MDRLIKVTQCPQGKNYVPFIRIAGKYLEQFNFNINDPVKVICLPDQIIIKKELSNVDKLNYLIDKNPVLMDFIDKLNLELTE